MNYGFVINNKTCIGCHACSVACKSENEVPLGVNRTWVKYVEKGEFPNTRRLFQVTRCNHCANPPCVRICPVTAMYQRQDGIVEFDPTVCIGCKACMQACPYDAIYMDPETHSAAKCHYCSHRTDIGLEPACVVVCPTRSIIAGDLNNPASEISQILSREQVSVRKPEQGTAPKLFYVDGDDTVLTPTASTVNFMWTELVSEQIVVSPAGDGYFNGDKANKTAKSGALIRTPGAQGDGYHGPIHIGEGRMAEQMVQTTYNAQHKVPWHWPVPAYLVTKGVGSGIFAWLAILFGFELTPFNQPLAYLGNLMVLCCIGLTALLLIMDLDKPHLFYTILLRPQWKSWLARGALILISFGAVAGLWLLVEGVTLTGLVAQSVIEAIRVFLWGLGFMLAVATAIYTAFLFGQAEGRDLWQSTLLPSHLLVQAAMAGSGALLILSVFVDVSAQLVNNLIWIFAITLVIDLFVTLFGEFGMPHASEVASRAAHAISEGSYRYDFWGGSIILGHIVPLILLAIAGRSASISSGLVAMAALATIIGLYLFEYAFVMAPQEIPNS